MRRKYLMLILLFSVFFTSVKAQKDTTLLGVVKGGEVSGYLRNYFMSTTNFGELQDWYAYAIGGYLKYETGQFKHFSFSVGLYTSNNLDVFDVATVDATTGKQSRYETGLFDIDNLGNKSITFMGEAYIHYVNKKHEVKWGRFKLKSPLINPQDGRMYPTTEQGLWYKYSHSKKLSGELGWITHIAPRSGHGFATVANSLGLYPQGRSTLGGESDYRRNITSLGIGLASITYTDSKFGFEFRDYFVENIFNTAFIQPYYTFGEGGAIHKISAQYINQFRVNNGGAEDIKQSYFQDKTANVIGLQYKVDLEKDWVITANANHVTGDGRFLFPREWGREFIFVFQKRERLEGVSNANAWMVDVEHTFKIKKRFLKAKLGYGQYYRPDVKNVAANKYGMPSNDQLNLDLFFFANKNKQGFGLEWLTSYKRPLADTYGNAAFEINKVNMINHNIILNYVF